MAGGGVKRGTSMARPIHWLRNQPKARLESKITRRRYTLARHRRQETTDVSRRSTSSHRDEWSSRKRTAGLTHFQSNRHGSSRSCVSTRQVVESIKVQTGVFRRAVFLSLLLPDRWARSVITANLSVAAEPSVESLNPRVLQRGVTSEVKVRRGWFDALPRIEILFAGIQCLNLEVVDDYSVIATLKVDPDCRSLVMHSACVSDEGFHRNCERCMLVVFQS